MLSQVYAPALDSLNGSVVEVECDITNGLPGFVVVGLADKAVGEARERVRSAIKNSGLDLPARRITLNLAPADLPKDGTGYDLAIAIALLVASGQVDPSATTGCLFFGELALNGQLRPAKGAILGAELALQQGFKRIYLPRANSQEAAMISGIEIVAIDSLAQLNRYLHNTEPHNVVKATTKVTGELPQTDYDFQEIYGQHQAKRALEIAAAGGHNILLSGPPGSGKTLMSRALQGILPPPSPEEILETTKLYSLTGLNQNRIMRQRPFRAPHHTASSKALIGGGNIPRPGEVSLSHNGVLFLDELPEFSRNVLEVLRQPLEEGRVTIARAWGATTFPARFMLAATANPCPCGYLGDARCKCQGYTVLQYQRRLSGPLLDRIDLMLRIEPVSNQELTKPQPGEPSSAIRQRVAAARRLQAQRYDHLVSPLNAYIGIQDLKTFCQLDTPTRLLAKSAITNLQLSARSYSRILKVARTIADLRGASCIALADFSEALQYRTRSLEG
jgi:magnesium chelatase family protein